MQNELNMECNSMSAQEEMLHSLIHNISVEFHKFNPNQAAMGPAKVNKKITDTSSAKPSSFLESRAKQAYENMWTINLSNSGILPKWLTARFIETQQK